MINYDNFTSYLNKDPNIRSDTNFLFNYIDSLYKMYNREKMLQFYTHIPTIFDKIFGISKFNYIKINKTCLIELLNNENVIFEELNSLLHLFIPINIKNLYFAVSNPPEYVPDIKMSTSLISKSVNLLSIQHKHNYSNFHDL